MINFFAILDGLGIRHSYVYPYELFQSQERNLTLWGCKKMLENFRVKVVPVRIESKALEEVTYPFVYQTSEGMFVATEEPADAEAFCREWDGYALLCDTSRAREPRYLWHKLSEVFIYRLHWFAWAGALLTLLCFLREDFSVSKLLLAVFNLLGLFFSYRSAVNECAGSCSVVTESAAGKLFGYSLSVIGLAYFGVSLFPALFVPAWMPLWSWIAVLALAMPLWSICYQAFVVHAWCKNCLVVQLMVLLSGVVVMCNGLSLEGVFRLQPLIVLPSLYVLAVYGLDHVFWLYQTVKQPPMDYTVLRLMRAPVLRDEILRSGRVADTSHVPDLWVMNPEAEQELFLAISLRCSHCKEQFFKLYKEVEKGGLKDYRIKLALSQPAVDKKMVEALAATALHKGREAALKLLAYWYEEQNQKLFMRKVDKNLPMEGVREQLECMNQALRVLEVTNLPFVALNGYEVTPTIFWAKKELEA